MLLNINYKAPDTLSDLEVTVTNTGLKLTWTIPLNSQTVWATDIYYSETNNRATATLLKRVILANQFSMSALGLGTKTYYFWVRAVGYAGQTNGAWFPSSTTAGISGTTGLTNTQDITASAITTTSIISNSSTIEKSDVYKTFEEILSINLTGEGYPNILTTSMDISGGIIGALRATGYAKYTLTDTTSGGSVATTAKTTYGSNLQTSSGKTAWVNPTNGTAADATYITNTIGASGSEKLYLYNFGFTGLIPSTASIEDIKIYVKATYSGGNATPPTFNTRLCFDGANYVTDNTRYVSEYSHSFDLTTTNTEYVTGWHTYLRATWGMLVDTWTNGKRFITTADIRNTTFGIEIEPTLPQTGRVLSIDYVGIEVTYTTTNIVARKDAVLINPNGSVESPTGRIAYTLTAGRNYNYKVEWIKYSEDDTNTGVTFSRANLINTVQVFKR
jgi:hypothetical protein